MKCQLSEIRYYYKLASLDKQVCRYIQDGFFITIKGECQSSLNVYKINVWLDSRRIELVTDEGSIFFASWNEPIEIVELRNITNG